MFCAGFHDINSCRLDAGMTEQVRQFRDIFFEVVKCPRKQEIENILKTAGFILFFLKKSLDISSASRYNNTRRQGYGPRRKEYADVAELADALDSGSSSLKRVWVQIPSSAP